MNGPSPSAHKALRYYSVLLKLYPCAFQRAFGAQMRQTFLDQFQDILVLGGRPGLRFWIEVAGDEALSILREHTSALKGALDDMDKHRQHIGQWGIGFGVALAFALLVIMYPGVLKVSVALAALTVVGSIPVLVIVSGIASARHMRTPFGSVAASWHLPVNIVYSGMAALGALALFVVSQANQPVVACGAPARNPSLSAPAALVTAQDLSDQGDFDYERGKCDEAIADYSRAIQLDPEYAAAHNNRAYTYMVKKEYAAALPDLDRAIQLRPDYVNALMNRGDIYTYYQVDYARAIADYERVLALGPAAYQGTPLCSHLAIARNRGQLPVTWVGSFSGSGACAQ